MYDLLIHMTEGYTKKSHSPLNDFTGARKKPFWKAAYGNWSPCADPLKEQAQSWCPHNQPQEY